MSNEPWAEIKLLIPDSRLSGLLDCLQQLGFVLPSAVDFLTIFDFRGQGVLEFGPAVPYPDPDGELAAIRAGRR